MQPSPNGSRLSELRLAPGGGGLVLRWDNGASRTITAGRLRRACRCAECTARARWQAPDAADPAVGIVSISLVGAYGVTATFGDGHARGIFPWPNLEELAAE